jgi:CrcB protein
MSTAAWIGFLAAAAIGAPARYLLDVWVRERTTGVFPWGTLVVNVTGSFLLGAITGLALYHGLDPTVRTVVGTGGIGAYTTFSTFTFETVRLAEEGVIDGAVRNALGSVIVGLAAAGVGLALAAVV